MVQASTRAVKVLVADDSESERATARSTLRAVGYAVVEAVDGQQALEVYARERPDLVMLDVVMPRLTGLETCRILKAKTQSSYLPVIMLSTRNSVNARVEGLRSGADDYLGKPYDADELVARVEALLRARRSLREDGPPEAAKSPSSDGIDSVQRRRLEEEFDRAERYSDPLACLRVELDASVDAGEPDTGRALHAVVQASVRKIDIIFPSGGRGFLLLLPNTHFPGALAVAERICKDARATMVGGQKLSVSIGVSFYPNRQTNSLQDLIDLVETALQQAREEGGGKICLYQHQGYLYAPEA